jgi:hypothetical protein
MLRICRYVDTEGRQPVTVRQVRADADGRFTSGPIPEGDYYVYAAMYETDEATDQSERFMLQSAPVYLYAGVTPPEFELDLRFVGGRLDVVLFDGVAADGRYVVEGEQAAVAVFVHSYQLTPRNTVRALWEPRDPPTRWPVVCDRVFHRLTYQSEWTASQPLIPGDYELAVSTRLLFRGPRGAGGGGEGHASFSAMIGNTASDVRGTFAVAANKSVMVHLALAESAQTALRESLNSPDAYQTLFTRIEPPALALQVEPGQPGG